MIELSTPKGRHYSQTVVIAAGCGAIVPRKLDIPHLTDLEGHGIHYFLPSFEPLRGERVLIVGGGNSAVDWALSLTGITRTRRGRQPITVTTLRRPPRRSTQRERKKGARPRLRRPLHRAAGDLVMP